MDDIVKQALAKWPNVPHCYGWLGLDARGQWYLRDAQAQAEGAFAQSRGARLEHEKLIEFIGRNYEHDEAGQWFFQNGPQRVYVELELTPWVCRIADDGRVTTHTGSQVDPTACLTDEEGRVYLVSELGLGLVHSLDVAAAADQIEAGRWTPEEVKAADLPARFGFVVSPSAAHA
ncbi:DUF2946 family protein [Variovorax dokdonensis]|uniref:DUF2946 family protein n=1 Tax=Variovorax dokdonensis TaxID=344883 RepID=A0ABT7NG40_9BURK|nr:DUF2946 family protein [Variovorax dokdonensis]MDM0046922.1 DUF2946 family protein [Variovorax dokdonensis]